MRTPQLLLVLWVCSIPLLGGLGLALVIIDDLGGLS